MHFKQKQNKRLKMGSSINYKSLNVLPLFVWSSHPHKFTLTIPSRSPQLEFFFHFNCIFWYFINKLIMDNPEEIMQILERFSKVKNKDFSKENI